MLKHLILLNNMRVPVDYSSGSVANYKDFCKKNKEIKVSLADWKTIIYGYNQSFREYLLETGKREVLPCRLGSFYINKKKRRKMKGTNGKEFINLPIDWQKTKEKGKVIYNFNYDTDGYFFGWGWYKKVAIFRLSSLWFFKPSRETSRLLAHYIKVDKKYQEIYSEWRTK